MILLSSASTGHRIVRSTVGAREKGRPLVSRSCPYGFKQQVSPCFLCFIRGKTQSNPKLVDVIGQSWRSSYRANKVLLPGEVERGGEKGKSVDSTCEAFENSLYLPHDQD